MLEPLPCLKPSQRLEIRGWIFWSCNICVKAPIYDIQDYMIRFQSFVDVKTAQNFSRY